jgi:CRISPR-associated protein Csm1
MLKIEFFKPDKLIEEWCNLCLTNPILKEEQECKQCEIQRNIGSNLPKKDFITFVYDLDATKNIQGTPIPFKNFGITVYLQDKVNIEELFKNNFKKEIHIQKINPEFNENIGLDFLMENAEKKPISFGFKLLGNSAPISKKSYQILSPPHEPVEKGDVLEFEEIAELSSGAKYLGILKIDIDHLGLLFGIGLENPSISRIATLSSNIEIFFNGWINKICEEITREWNSNLEENDLRKGLVESLFYIVYSGGDDLFIIGPWDQVIDLALKIYNDFKQYTSENPNITLSGGIFFVKPAFPIQRFSILVTKELENAKKLGRNKVTLFGETVEWRDNTKSLESLIKFAKELSNEVENKEKPLSKSFVYFLINLKKAFHIGIKNKEDINWIPHFLYSHARRVTKEVEERLNLRTQFMEKRSKIKIPVSYVSLKTRKE